MSSLQRALETKMAADIVAAVKKQDAAAFAAALGVEKTPSLEKLVRRRTVARLADAIEKRDAAAFLATRMAAEKSGPSSKKVAMSKQVRDGSAREVSDKSRKLAALASVLQSEEAVRLVAGLKSEDAAAVFAALRSKDAAAVTAALRTKDAAALSSVLGPAAKSRSHSGAPAEAAVGVPSARSVDPANITAPSTSATPGDTRSIQAALRFKDSKVLMAYLKPAEKAAVMAAVKSRDMDVIKAVLKSESVASVITDLRAKGLILQSSTTKSETPTPAAAETLPVTASVGRPDSAATVNVSDARRPGDAVARSSAPVSVKYDNRAALVAALESENAGALAAALESGGPAVPPAALRSRAAAAAAVSPKSKRGLALKGKVAPAVRTKSAAAKAAAAKLKAAATTLAAKKAKKRARCQEPVLCVFAADMRCPWHAVYVPDGRHAAAGGAVVPKREAEAPKVEVKEDPEVAGLEPVNKKMKMELDELTPDISCIVGEVEMKMETDEMADDMLSVSGSGNQADLSTESTLSATSPRADDDDMDDDCRDMDVDAGAGAEEVMLQPPLGADDADLVAVAQGVAMVGAQEEVAVIQQDEDSLTNPPAAVDEVEVS